MRFYSINPFKTIALYLYMIAKYRTFRVMLYISSFQENGFQPYLGVLSKKYYHMVPINGIKLIKK